MSEAYVPHFTGLAGLLARQRYGRRGLPSRGKRAFWAIRRAWRIMTAFLF